MAKSIVWGVVNSDQIRDWKDKTGKAQQSRELIIVQRGQRDNVVVNVPLDYEEGDNQEGNEYSAITTERAFGDMIKHTHVKDVELDIDEK